MLPGLSTAGVPKSLRGNVHPFNYNDLSELERLIKTKSIGVIKMEVYRNIEPKNKFLEKIRDLASSNGIVLIFDECTSGFRERFGGLHVKYGVEPDIAVYGKTLGNGYAVSAVVGCESVMQSAQSTFMFNFLDGTYWFSCSFKNVGNYGERGTLGTCHGNGSLCADLAAGCRKQ